MAYYCFFPWVDPTSYKGIKWGISREILEKKLKEKYGNKVKLVLQNDFSYFEIESKDLNKQYARKERFCCTPMFSSVNIIENTGFGILLEKEVSISLAEIAIKKKLRNLLDSFSFSKIPPNDVRQEKLRQGVEGITFYDKKREIYIYIVYTCVKPSMGSGLPAFLLEVNYISKFDTDSVKEIVRTL